MLNSVTKDEENKKEGKIKKRFSLKTIRSYTNGLILVFRALVLGLLVDLIRIVVDDQKEGYDIDWSRITIITVLVLIVIISFIWERWNNREAETREKTEREMDINLLAQERALDHAFGSMLPKAGTIIEEMELLKEIPMIVSNISMSDVRKQISYGFEKVGEALAKLSDNMKDSSKRTKDLLKSDFDRAIGKIEDVGHMVKRKKVKDSDLLPPEA